MELITNDRGCSELIYRIVMQACQDYYEYRRMYYRYGAFMVKTFVYKSDKDRTCTVHYLDMIPDRPKPGKHYTDKQLVAWHRNWHSKMMGIYRRGKDAEEFFNNRDGWFEFLLGNMDGNDFMRKLDAEAWNGKKFSMSFYQGEQYI